MNIEKDIEMHGEKSISNFSMGKWNVLDSVCELGSGHAIGIRDTIGCSGAQ